MHSYCQRLFLWTQDRYLALRLRDIIAKIQMTLA
jgi:hypothetical protein